MVWHTMQLLFLNNSAPLGSFRNIVSMMIKSVATPMAPMIIFLPDILVTRASFHCSAGRCGTYSRMIAVTGQLSTACWQSQVSQPFGSMTHALSSLSSKTIGQSSEQSPQPMQRSRSTRGAAIMTAILSRVSWAGTHLVSYFCCRHNGYNNTQSE